MGEAAKTSIDLSVIKYPLIPIKGHRDLLGQRNKTMNLKSYLVGLEIAEEEWSQCYGIGIVESMLQLYPNTGKEYG